MKDSRLTVKCAAGIVMWLMLNPRSPRRIFEPNSWFPRSRPKSDAFIPLSSLICLEFISPPLRLDALHHRKPAALDLQHRRRLDGIAVFVDRDFAGDAGKVLRFREGVPKRRAIGL